MTKSDAGEAGKPVITSANTSASGQVRHFVNRKEQAHAQLSCLVHTCVHPATRKKKGLPRCPQFFGIAVFGGWVIYQNFFLNKRKVHVPKLEGGRMFRILQ